MLIGEVSRRSGISARMLRYYDSVGLVSPTGRTSAGYREYAEEDVRRLFHVEGLRSLGLSLHDIAVALDDLSFSPADLVERLVIRTRERLAQDEELLRRLGQVRASNPAAWSDVLRTIGLVRGLGDGDPSARQRFVLSLADGGERDVVTVAEAALNEPDPNVANALDWVLARVGDGAVPMLAAALDSPVAERRHRAVTALVKIGSACAYAVLADAVRHPDPLVSGRATLARGARGEADAVPALVALVVDGRDDVEAADVLGALASEHGRADEITRVIAHALTSTGAAARRRLTQALSEIPGPRAQATLIELVDDPDRQVAVTASALVQVRSSGR